MFQMTVKKKKRMRCDTSQDSGRLSRQDLFMEIRVSNLQISHHYLPRQAIAHSA